MSITTIEKGSVRTDSLEYMRSGAVIVPNQAASRQSYLEDRENMRLISGLLIEGTQGVRNVARPLSETLKKGDRLTAALQLGWTLMRHEMQQVFCAGLEILAEQPALADELVARAKEENVDILFVAESNLQRRDFSIIRRLVTDFPGSPVIGVGDTDAHLRYLPGAWQQEIEAGLNQRQVTEPSIS